MRQAMSMDHMIKFRAECMQDVGELLLRIDAQRVEIVHIERDLPDVEVTVDRASIEGRALTAGEVASFAEGLEGCHVIAETVRALDEYTGERTYTEAPDAGI